MEVERICPVCKEADCEYHDLCQCPLYCPRLNTFIVVFINEIAIV